MYKQHIGLLILCLLTLLSLSINYSSYNFAQVLENEQENILPKKHNPVEIDEPIVETALHLDGKNSFVEIRNNATINNITGQVTVSLWIKPVDIPNRYSNILHKTDMWIDGITHRSYILNFKEGGSIQFAASPDSLNEASLYSPPGVIKLHTWYHIAGVINPQKDYMKLYINGEEVGFRDFKGRRRLHKSRLPLRIGYSHEDRVAASPFVGYIDEVSVWNIVRTEAEIRSEMKNKLKGDERGLVGYWKFDQETNGNISDDSTNQNPGRLEGNSKLSEYVRPVSADANPNQLAKIAKVYEDLLLHQTNMYDVYHNLATIYTKTNRLSDAEKVYQQALRSDLSQSEFEDAIQSLYRLYKGREALNDFITILEEMQPNMEDSSILHKFLGDSYKKIGEDEKAIIAYTQWIKIRQREVEINKHATDYRLLAEELLNKNLFPEIALELSQKALEIYSSRTYIITHAHAVLANEMYDNAFNIINNFLNYGYYQYIERDMFKRIILAGKNVKDKDGYVELLNMLIEALSDDLPAQLNTMLALAQFYIENGLHEKATELIQQTGFVMEDAWMTLGPFDNVDGIGFNTPYIPENLPKIDGNIQYEGLNGLVSWRKYTDDFLNGYINLRHNANWSVAYAFSTVFCPDEREVEFRFDSNDQGKVWVNGIEVHAHTRAYSADIDRDIIPITLNPGKNSILVKVCEEYDGTGFYLRITDKEGNPYDDLKVIGFNENN